MSAIKPKIKKRKSREENEKMGNISSSIEGREVEEGQKFQY
jgi:hypothetical protein